MDLIGFVLMRRGNSVCSVYRIIVLKHQFSVFQRSNILLHRVLGDVWLSLIRIVAFWFYFAIIVQL